MTVRPVLCFVSVQNILFSCVGVSSRVLSVLSFVVVSTVVHIVDNLHCVSTSHLAQEKQHCHCQSHMVAEHLSLVTSVG